MRDYLIGAVTIATGIIVAVVTIAGVWWTVSPAAKVQVSLADYSCVTDGKAVTCERK